MSDARASERDTRSRRHRRSAHHDKCVAPLDDTHKICTLPVADGTKVSPETITVAHIRELEIDILRRRSGDAGDYEDLCACHTALKPIGRGYPKASRERALTRCANAYNRMLAMRGAK